MAVSWGWGWRRGTLPRLKIAEPSDLLLDVVRLTNVLTDLLTYLQPVQWLIRRCGKRTLTSAELSPIGLYVLLRASLVDIVPLPRFRTPPTSEIFCLSFLFA